MSSVKQTSRKFYHSCAAFIRIFCASHGSVIDNSRKGAFFPINDSLCTVSVSVMGINLQVINSDSSEKLLELLELLLLFYRSSKFTRNVNSLLWGACQSSTL